MIILGTVLLIFILILFIPVSAEFKIKNTDVKVSIKILGIPIKKIKTKKKEKKEPDKESFEKSTKSFTQKIKDFIKLYKTTVRLTKKYVKVKNTNVEINFGTGEAATTAVSTGALWAIVCGAVSALSHITKMDKPEIKINPVFNTALFDARAGCILYSRLVYIIIIAITLLLKIKEEE